LILAVKSSDKDKLSFGSLRSGNPRVFKMPIIYSSLAGLSLGCYLLTWMRGALLVFIILLWITIQYIIDHLKRTKADYLFIVGIPCFLIALLMDLPILGHIRYAELQVASLLSGLLAVPVLTALSIEMSRRNLRPAFYPLAVLSLMVIALAAFY